MREAVIIRPMGRGLANLDIALGLACVMPAAIGSRWMGPAVAAVFPLSATLVICLYSHKRRMLSEENDRPILVAGLAAFVVLFVMMFNYAEVMLWGFAQFALMPALAWWIALAALLLVWHARSLTLLDRASDWLGRRGPLPWYLFYPPIVALFWALRSYYITEDGFGCIGVAYGSVGLDCVGREPLAYLAMRVAFFYLTAIGADARDAVWAVSILSGVASIIALRRLWHLWQLDARQMALAWGATAATFGVAQMGFGHVEVYPPFVASVIWLFYLSSKALRQAPSRTDWQSVSPLWLPGLAYALAFAFHLAAAWLAPAMLALIVLANRGRSRRDWWRPAAQLALPFLAVHGALWSIIFAFGFQFDAARFGDTLLDLVTAGRMTPAFYSPTEMGLRYWLDRSQMLFLLCGAPIALLAFSMAFPSLHERRWRARRLLDSEMLFFLACLCGFGVYVFFWREEREWIQDWDIFAGFAPMVLIVTLKIIFRRNPTRPLLRAFQIVLGFFLVIGGMKTAFFHTNPSAVYHGFYVPRQNGYMLQKYMVDHPYEYGLRIPYMEDGRIVFAEDMLSSPPPKPARPAPTDTTHSSSTESSPTSSR